MEICTYIVRGELTHQDSMGTKETLTRGAVQFMTAGGGVHHQEHNLHKEKDLRFIQIWIQPRQRGLKANYGSYRGEDESIRQNKW
jgi:redox-sensitive bicupin YhaK (pirin superfamily)